MLGHAKLESFVEIDSDSPGVLNADGIGRPCIECLRDGLAEEKCGRAVYHEAAQLGSAKRTHFKNSRQHIASEQAAGVVDATVGRGITGAKVRINLVVRRRQVELRPAPEHVAREKHAVAVI